MSHVLRVLAVFFFSLGGFGLLLLGVLDSSFLFMPLGNDLLVIALTAARPSRMAYYVLMATVGSVAGVDLTRWLSAKGGRKGIRGDRRSKRIANVERKVRENGGIAIATAALMPPPFPFTPFIIVASALQYPALVYGRKIIGMARSPYAQAFIVALVVISMVGSAYSIYSWIRKSRTRS